jgi:hypothetical protein
MPRDVLTRVAARGVPALLAIALVACGTTSGSSESATGSNAAAATPGPVGGELGALPGVQGFAYREQPALVPGFAERVTASLGGTTQAQVFEAAVASRGEDEVAVIAFGFPGATDAQAVDDMARVLDNMEQGFQAPAERGLDGEGYVMNFNGQMVVMAPWGHIDDQLVFLFFHGPTEATQDLSAAILNATD